MDVQIASQAMELNFSQVNKVKTLYGNAFMELQTQFVDKVAKCAKILIIVANVIADSHMI